MIQTMLWLGCLCFVTSLALAVQAAQAAQDRKEIVIGTHLSLSGVQAATVIHQRWAYERAVGEINRAGGIFVKEYNKKLPVRLIIVDDESDPSKSAAVVERLIKRDKVDMILGGQTGVLTIPAMVTAEKYKFYYQSCSTFPEQFKEQHFTWPTMFWYEPFVGAEMTFRVWQALPEDQRPKKPAVVVEDSFDGKTIGDGWEAIGGKFGYKFAERETLTVGAKDFTSQVLKVKEAGVDAILCLADTPMIVTFIRQSHENQYNFKWFQGFKGTWSPDFYKAMGKDADYVLADGFWSMDFPFKGAKELGEAWHKQFGNYSITTGVFYANAQILFDAIEKAGTLDGAKVRQAVLDHTFDTVMGKIKYDKDGIALFLLADFQWWNGKQEAIFPLELTKYKVKPTPPWDKR
jgi:branched-chain amino acid transport system substrate-binding protein